MRNKILNAINEGIRKSLLSFDDIEFDKSVDTNQKVTKSIKDWKWILDNFVDLGLPSGTLWCKWNIGATNDDTAESWYGNYYAWGELCPKNTYTEESYTYNEHPELLPLSNDIAYQTNNLMCIPTLEQISELRGVPNEWVTNYNGITGLTGILFTGLNGNELFVPLAGCHGSGGIIDQGSHCYLWSSQLCLDTYNFAYGLFFGGFLSVSGGWRYCGFGIRPVLR